VAKLPPLKNGRKINCNLFSGQSSSQGGSTAMSENINFIDKAAKIGKNFRCGLFVIIESDVIIGQNVSVGNYVRIMSGTKIGNNVELMDYVKLMPGTIIGDNCKLDDYVNTSGYVEIGNNVRIKRCTMIGQAVKTEDDVWIGSHVTTTRIKYPKVMEEEEEKEEWIVFKKGCLIGSASLILAGTTVGKGAVVAAGATVTRDCEPYGIYVGVPAKLVRYRNVQK
jgi:UDP-2-acetamido-3-amino-2,3-dideoxy-glucuronate N-acetyltransferase